MTSTRTPDERAVRRTAALVVETAELRAAIVRMFRDDDLLSQMATLVQDGSAEYERVVTAMREIKNAHSLAQAKRIAAECLDEI